MENSAKFFCKHCGVFTDHKLFFPVRGSGVIRYISVCGICLTQSVYETRATDEEIRAVRHVHYLCLCGIHIRGKIISEKDGTTNIRGKEIKYTEITVECPRPGCHKKMELVI